MTSFALKFDFFLILPLSLCLHLIFDFCGTYIEKMCAHSSYRYLSLIYSLWFLFFFFNFKCKTMFDKLNENKAILIQKSNWSSSSFPFFREFVSVGSTCWNKKKTFSLVLLSLLPVRLHYHTLEMIFSLALTPNKSDNGCSFCVLESHPLALFVHVRLWPTRTCPPSFLVIFVLLVRLRSKRIVVDRSFRSFYSQPNRIKLFKSCLAAGRLVGWSCRMMVVSCLIPKCLPFLSPPLIIGDPDKRLVL